MGIKFPTPWKTLIIKFPPPRDGKGVKCPGYAPGMPGGGHVEASIWPIHNNDRFCNAYSVDKSRYNTVWYVTCLDGQIFSWTQSLLNTMWQCFTSQFFSFLACHYCCFGMSQKKEKTWTWILQWTSRATGVSVLLSGLGFRHSTELFVNNINIYPFLLFPIN